MRNKIYPRPGDTQIVYLQDVVTGPNIEVGLTPYITTSFMIPGILKRITCCIITLSTETG